MTPKQTKKRIDEIDQPTKAVNKTNILIILLTAIALIGITGIYQLITIKTELIIISQTINQSTINTNDIGIKLNGQDLNKKGLIVLPVN